MKAVHLGYHYVRDGKAPGPNCSPNRLKAHISALKNEGYEIMICGEVVSRLRANKPLPEKHATLSFDDGLSDQYTTVFPILKEFGVPATFFYITCALEKKLPPVIGLQILIEKLGAERLEKEILPKVFAGTPYLDLLDHVRYDASGRKPGETLEVRRIKWMFNHWPSQAFKRDKLDEIFSEYVGEGSQEKSAESWFMSSGQLLEMQKESMEIASHSVSHPPFDVSGLDEIRTEAVLSQKQLADVIGNPVRTFAWTFGGKFNEKTRKVLAGVYDSSWNFFSTLKAIPENAYSDLSDIPRMHEQVFMPEIK